MGFNHTLCFQLLMDLGRERYIDPSVTVNVADFPIAKEVSCGAKSVGSGFHALP